ncbi:protein kinase domain-containing protein [Catenulispora pinisilvae]|uniref:serine/threonine-protein kinase n=1 Tax=Catenulispora pinisilvae TaxID=2705253 RepID=UPI001E4D5145|nr:PQQ-binding-like beta-propeller repeat protein [Catenulispora pinisilvae]
MPTQLPDSIGPYRVVRELGAGAMGRVFLAAGFSGRNVAVKVVRAELAALPEFRERFAAEVAAARAVNGVFTAPVVDADPDAALPWLATAYVAGPSLLDAVDRYGPMAEPDVRRLAVGLIEAVGAIHAARVVHGDLKPGNVMLSDAGPRVIDFGISRALEGMPVSLQEPVFGTPGYVSPEQARQESTIDPASDVFSLGAVLCFAATGHGPFDRGSAAGLSYRVLYEEPILDGIPDRLLGLIEACLRKDPALRPAPADLLGFLGEQEPETVGSSGWTFENSGSLAFEGGGRFDAAAQPDWHFPFPTGPDAQPPRPHAGTGLSRRAVLTATGGIALAAAVGVGVAVKDSGTPKSATKTSKPSTSSSPGTDELAALPAGPEPVWTLTPPAPPASGPLAVMGSTVVWTPVAEEQTTQPSSVVAVDAATGVQAWKADEIAPSGQTGSTRWFGVFDGALVGFSQTTDIMAGKVTATVFGLDPQGKQAFQVTTSDTNSQLYYAYSGYALSGRTLLFSYDSLTKPSISALDLDSGQVRWSQPVGMMTAEMPGTVTADAQRCYFINASAVHGVDMSTGKQVWSIPTAAADGASRLAVAGTSLLVSVSSPMAGGPGASFSANTACLDSATGKTKWVATGSSLLGATDTSIYAMSVTGGVAALDPETGKLRWGFGGQHASTKPQPEMSATVLYPPSFVLNAPNGPYVSDEVLVLGCMTDEINKATPSMTSAPSNAGFVVLDAGTGKPLWRHTGIFSMSYVEGWPLAVSGSMIYTATSSTLYAFDASKGTTGL